MIVVGDLHGKTKQPYKDANLEFLDWLVSNYKNEEVIFLGDIFDNSSPHAEIELDVIDRIIQFKRSHLITGNHDRSDTKGNTLLPHKLHKNISLYEDVTEVEIEGNNCLILPFKQNFKEYENLEGNYKFIFTHITPVECQFAEEGLVFDKLKGTFIHGHTHISIDFTDKQSNNHFVIGVPLETRHLEAQKHRIFEIKDGIINTIEVPFYFTHETINYGDEPSSKKNILNIKNAPTRKLAFEKYKDYYIRDEGIELLRTDATKADFKKEFSKSNLLEKFRAYAKDKGLSKEVIECCSTRLSRIV